MNKKMLFSPIRFRLLPLLTASIPSLFLMSFRGESGGNDAVRSRHYETTNDSLKGFKSLLGNESAANIASGHFELNPNVVPFVTDFISKQSGYLEKMKSWGQPYFTLYEHILSSYTLPAELKYLSVIESGLQAATVSSAGAAGPWQLMPAEARRFGLKVNSGYDERTNFQKSTVAASKLLKELYGEFGDWLLVIAAYNAGAGSVNRAIKKSGSRSFWDLQFHLPEETRNHVKKYIAAHYYFEKSGGWTTLTAQETINKKELLAGLAVGASDTLTVAAIENIEVSGKYNSVVLTKNILMDITEFNRLNPLFDKTLAEGKKYSLRLPSEKVPVFKAKRQLILQESVQLLLSSVNTVLPIPPSGK